MTLLFTVAHSFRVPGLGVIALPREQAPLLQPLALHTALLVKVVLPAGRSETITATVEEVEHQGTSRRGLLLEFITPTLLPAGTQVVSMEAIPLSNNTMSDTHLL